MTQVAKSNHHTRRTLMVAGCQPACRLVGCGAGLGICRPRRPRYLQASQASGFTGLAGLGIYRPRRPRWLRLGNCKILSSCQHLCGRPVLGSGIHAFAVRQDKARRSDDSFKKLRNLEFCTKKSALFSSILASAFVVWQEMTRFFVRDLG